MKQWLKENKIYFEIFGITSLSIMAIIVSCESNRITNNQIQVTKMESQPFIEFQRELKYDAIRGVRTDDEIMISNKGGPLREFSSIYITFLKVEHEEFGNISMRKRIVSYIPLSEYYNTTMKTFESVGTLELLTNPKNFRKLSEFYMQLSVDTRAKNIYIYSALESYFRINYIDIYGETKIEYYMVGEWGAKIKLQKKDAEKMFMIYKDKVDKREELSIDSLSPKKLYSLLNI